MTDIKKRRRLYLFGGAGSLVFLGFLYGWSILAAPLQAEFGWTSAQTSLVFAVTTAMFSVGGVLGAQFSRLFSPQRALALCALLVGAGYGFSALVTADSIQILHLTYGVLVGTGSGAALNAVMGMVTRWFPDRPGAATGSLSFGFGIGSLALGWAVSLVIGALGWRAAFIALGAVTAGVTLAASFFLALPAPGQVLPAPPPPKGAAADLGGGLELTTGQMLRQPVFYIVFLVSVLFACIYLGIMGNAKQMAVEAGATLFLATMAVGAVSLGDGISRLTSGFFFDRFGYRISFFVIAACFLAAPLTLFAAFSFGSLPLVFGGNFVLGLGFGSISAVLAATTFRFYGAKHYASNLGVAYMDFLPAALIGPPLVGVIETAAGSFRPAFAALGVCGLAALGLCLVIKPPRISSQLGE
ncbi:MAG: MFS transporter [Gracilibacteraceae bacterium]|jgi:OFA family oxalate/formate antiporter-like MFS transporter|nr:MFS transporter [Gracilibacteraceae bacterium]